MQTSLTGPFSSLTSSKQQGNTLQPGFVCKLEAPYYLLLKGIRREIDIITELGCTYLRSPSSVHRIRQFLRIAIPNQGETPNPVHWLGPRPISGDHSFNRLEKPKLLVQI